MEVGYHARGERHGHLARPLTLAAALATGCNQGPSDLSLSDLSPSEAGNELQPPWHERLANPTVSTVLEALAQPHRKIRVQIGPHRLQYTLKLASQPPNDDQRFPIGSPVILATSITDQLELHWVQEQPQPQFALTQQNDHDRGRSIIVKDGQMWARLRHRTWRSSGIETDAHETWLNDAQRAAYDWLAFVAPWVELDLTNDGNEVVVLELTARADPRPIQNRDIQTPFNLWRASTTLTSCIGTLELDKHTGAWTRFSLKTEFEVLDFNRRKIRVSAEFLGTVTTGDPRRPVQAPKAEPTDIRFRPELVKDRLLGFSGRAG